MQWIIFMALVITAAIIFLQDFIYRSVHALLFVLLAVLGVTIQLLHVPVQEFAVNCLINVISVSIQICITLAILRLSGKKEILKMIGPGDLLFLLCCCLLFTPFSLLFFLVTSFAASLLLHLAFARNSMYAQRGATVALAGWQSLVLVIVFCTGILSGIELFTDEWILNFVYEY
jgi:hypothetical protein